VTSSAAALSPPEPGPGDLLALAQHLVRTDTTNPPGNELPAARCVAEFLQTARLEVVLQEFAENRGNLVARLRGSGERGGLLFSGHLDTVPVGDADRWTVAPLGGLVRDERLFGRGALDMKGAVAAMAVVLRDLSREGTPKGDIVLALTAGEETDSCGARMLCEAGLLHGIDLAVIGEPTRLDVGIAHRGALWVRVDVHGEAAHGSQPAAGVNAVRGLMDWLDPLESIEALIAEPVDEVLGSGSASLNMISGGTSVNVVPDRAHAVLDFRTVPGHDHGEILAALEHRRGDALMTVLRDSPPIRVAADAPLARAAIDAVGAVEAGPPAVRGLPYLTDGSVFAERLGVDAVVLGPGSETQAHTEDESLAVRDLEQTRAIYEAIAQRLMY
jgi:succinyl-diaminopimelate desuccinylase